MQISERKSRIRELADMTGQKRLEWLEKNRFFYREDRNYMRFLIPEGLRVLDLGCGTGDLLAELRPSYGVGVDFSQSMLKVAEDQYPDLHFVCGDVEEKKTFEGFDAPFDVIVMSDTIGSLDDCEQTLRNLHNLCHDDTRIVICYYNTMWGPIYNAAGWFGLKAPSVEQNWLTTGDIENLLDLADFEVVKREWRQLLPRKLLGIGTLFNRFLAPFPLIRRLCLRNYIVARPVLQKKKDALSCTVLVPCRNERGNIEEAVKRIPQFCDDMEIIYVEGHSSDGTLDEIHRVIEAYPQHDIKVLVQPGKGKGDAVRAGFSMARGDILMILDADLTMPPEALPKFYRALASGKGEFINGSRLVYPMEKDAMRFLNHMANHVFSWLFTWLLNQRYTDTLCGTKVLSRKHYLSIVENRFYFGDFDPFGDFDLIFGASKLNLKVVEVPVRYASREYGETQISRFRHGVLLLRMVVFAFRKLKAF
ncbi:MAG: glycosyl transferase [Zetaproteobacteria bacterium CG12_big_fil_rev_8_21_14_0_65_55_1124]|nr:MAG: glycosyl transferase [Zetaproteobacteria bacterium CG1_02_55_237]PIS20528.1 MAG: glycosyl transferase [Zetaproteobacteria bacterium CG08_land_8_20_14_0_20_55_17]PIW43805.1 MAG: glycosyl transferase [Zetaproteobacteria bacterium CG12_big_fil_rev_8_21_14_0_65_55_1124]PIY53342.1 MAG: glycosyl transferase [Zetaproteobacteria bacterium CG_4_10_14_0_8_um_filter_55_43]PIZ40086.1 MAG: glycosyl transferase [Zetaproteobacteria bacterium CG_4_10_14_0_2_um_filter_55_20]PJB82091.1 MAG: glycosyl tra